MSANGIKKFTKEEKIFLFETVVSNLKHGISVRKSCYNLAKGDAKLMLRFQNKYRNMKNLFDKQTNLNRQTCNTQKNSKNSCKQDVYKKQDMKNTKNMGETSKNQIKICNNKTSEESKPNRKNKIEENILKDKNKVQDKKVINIASIKNKKNMSLTDSDINALFLGLVKLIKKTTMQNVSEDLKNDCVQANQNFRQSLIDLTNTQNLLKKEQQKNLELTVLIEEQKAKICLLLKKLKLKNGNVF